MASAAAAVPEARAAPEEELAAEDDDAEPTPLQLGELDITGQDLDFEQDTIQEHLEDEIVQEALDNGVDLRTYSRQVAKDLEVLERESIGDYIKEAGRLAQLHQQITSCDGILQNMEQMLSIFQADLGNISGEIQSLQEQSMSMNVKLTNRKAVQAPLSTFVNSLALSSELIDAILDLDVGDEFEAAVKELHAKLEFVTAQTDSTVSVDDVRADLDKLRIKAASKIRDYFITKIYQARKPLSDPHMPQNAMLKRQACFDFLLKHARPTANEVKDEYVDTMSKVHTSYFKAYLSRLLKLQFEEVPDKDDLLGADDSVKRSGGFFSSKPSLKNRSTTFTIGNRGDVLKQMEDPILVPHAAQDTKTAKEHRLPYEQLFRSYVYAMVDTGSREFLFCVEFFGVKDSKGYEFFKLVMGKAIMLVLKHLESHLANCYDAISVMLCARVVHFFQGYLASKEIVCMTTFLESSLKLLWPAFARIVGANTASVKAVDPEKLSKVDTRPHYIVRRYAEYFGALLGLNEEVMFPAVTEALAELRQEVTNLILRTAAIFDRRDDQLKFLISNYDLMQSVYDQRTTAASEEAEHVRSLLKSRIQEYALIQLEPAFGGMISFVKSSEAGLRTGKLTKETADLRKVEQLVASFAEGWRKNIDAIDSDVMRSFPNFKIGTAVLQEALTQLVLYYERFLALLRQDAYRNSKGWSSLVDRQTLLVEIKKHRIAF